MFLRKLTKPLSKWNLLADLPANHRVLDVGCGNDSPRLYKTRFPNAHYVGIDVGDYRQSQPVQNGQYIIVSPENFTNRISEFVSEFDAVVSSHNLEHCNDRFGTLRAMIKALKPGGRLFFSFPSERTVNFPSRAGTLNYFDDATHVGNPPDFTAVIAEPEDMGIEIIASSRSYRPIILTVAGFFLEPVSRFKKKVGPGTWAYYGFEALIWGRKK
jgi:SAM-dependent methyltransferase